MENETFSTVPNGFKNANGGRMIARGDPEQKPNASARAKALENPVPGDGLQGST